MPNQLPQAELRRRPIRVSFPAVKRASPLHPGADVHRHGRRFFFFLSLLLRTSTPIVAGAEADDRREEGSPA